MTNVNRISSGPPIPSTILVNVDNETVVGDGSLENPISVVGGAPPAPTSENLEVETTAGAAADPEVTTSFVTYTGDPPEGPTDVDITLANGTVDGQQKQFVLSESSNITWQVIPASADGFARVTFPDGYGSLILTWSQTDEEWSISGSGVITILTS